MIKLKDILNEAPDLTDKQVKSLVDKANKYINQAIKDDVNPVEPDSTWESVYEFEPVKLSGKFVTFKYTDVYGSSSRKVHTERYKYDKQDEFYIDEMKYMFKWIIRAVKKGYKEEGKTPPKF